MGHSRGHYELSQVSGADSSKMAKGQKPSRSPQQTELTNGWFRCDERSCSNWSTLIGVTILNRWGWEVIVELKIRLWDSEGGTSGNGATISVNVAEGVHGDVSWTQKKPWLHLGHFQEVIPNSLHSLTCFSSTTTFHLVFIATDDTDVMILAGFGNASASVPLATDLNVQIIGLEQDFFVGDPEAWIVVMLTLMTTWCVMRSPNLLNKSRDRSLEWATHSQIAQPMWMFCLCCEGSMNAVNFPTTISLFWKFSWAVRIGIEYGCLVATKAIVHSLCVLIDLFIFELILVWLSVISTCPGKWQLLIHSQFLWVDPNRLSRLWHWHHCQVIVWPVEVRHGWGRGCLYLSSMIVMQERTYSDCVSDTLLMKAGPWPCQVVSTKVPETCVPILKLVKGPVDKGIMGVIGTLDMRL